MSPMLMGLLAVEGLVTLAGTTLLLYRGYYDRQEEDQIILDANEAKMEKEQEYIRGRVAVLSRYVKMAGIAWSLLAVAILVVWVAEVVQEF